MSQQMNMNEKPPLERKKTPLYNLFADKNDQLGQEKWKEPTQGRTIEITEVEYRVPVPEAGYSEGVKPGSEIPASTEWTENQQNKPGVLEGAKDKLRQGVEKAKATFTSDKAADAEWTEDQQNKPGVMEGAKEKLRQGVEKAKATLSSATTTTTTTTTDESKTGVLQGAKNMVWQGVEKAKGLISSQPTEQHPGNGYSWKRVVDEQGQTRWVATNDWSSDSANRGGILEGAKGMVRSGVEMAKSGVEKAKTTFTSDKAADAEWTEDQKNKPSVLEGATAKLRQGVEKAKATLSSVTTTTTTDESKTGVLQGAKDMVMQGVEKAKGLIPSTTKTTEQTELHPGTGCDWKRVVGEQGEVRWVSTTDWSGDSSTRGGILQGAKGMVLSGVEKAKGVLSTKDAKDSQEPGLLQGAKDKVWQGVEKAKSVFSSASTEQHPGRSYAWHKTTGPQGQTHWQARNDWSNDSANQQNSVIQGAKDKVQGAKEKVWQGVEKAKGMLPSTKTTETTEQTGTEAL